MPLHTDCPTSFCGVQECEQVLEVLRKQERDLAALVHPEQAYQASSQVCKLNPGVVFHAFTALQICKLHPGIVLCAYTSLQVCKLHLYTLCAYTSLQAFASQLLQVLKFQHAKLC